MFFISDTSSDSSDEEIEQKPALERSVMRQKSNILDVPDYIEIYYDARDEKKLITQKFYIANLPDNKFESYFLLNKTAFTYVLETIAPNLKNGFRSTSIPISVKLAATLNFLAQGSYQLSVGSNFNLGLAQPNVSKIMAEILEALEMTICPQWINFEMTDAEKNEAKQKFFEETGFPGVIGCVDGTFIKIIGPKKNEKFKYIDRNGFFSLNAMIICDHKMRIRFIDAENAGSVHDSVIWNRSQTKRVLQARYTAGERNSWLLGDAEYPLEPYLITPYRSFTEESAEAIFNNKHAKARNIVERAIFVLKTRFRCLSTRYLCHKPEKAAKIVYVCAALHNICLEYGLDNTYEDTKIEENSQSDEPYKELTQTTEGAEIRNKIKLSFL